MSYNIEVATCTIQPNISTALHLRLWHQTSRSHTRLMLTLWFYHQQKYMNTQLFFLCTRVSDTSVL